MTEVFVAAGSNVRPRKHLRQALAALRARYPDLRCSLAWRNAAVGFEGPDFINLVVGFETEESLAEVVARLRAVEEACGRSRLAPKWEPRSMDLDLLLYGDDSGQFPGATLPRPDLVERAFMLGPMAEIEPARVHPLLGKSYGELWAAFDQVAHPMVEVSLSGED